jgi:hypothetical protein
MTGYAIVNLQEVEDQAPKFGFSPGMEARFARVPLELENSGLSHFRFAPGFRQPFGHRHERQEEIYVLVGGSARAKIGDEVMELGGVGRGAGVSGEDARVRGGIGGRRDPRLRRAQLREPRRRGGAELVGGLNLRTVGRTRATLRTGGVLPRIGKVLKFRRTCRSRRVSCAQPQEIEPRPPVHAALDRLQARDLALGLAVGPREGAARRDRRLLPASLAREPRDLGHPARLGVGEPPVQFRAAADKVGAAGSDRTDEKRSATMKPTTTTNHSRRTA